MPKLAQEKMLPLSCRKSSFKIKPLDKDISLYLTGLVVQDRRFYTLETVFVMQLTRCVGNIYYKERKHAGRKCVMMIHELQNNQCRGGIQGEIHAF